MPCTPLSCRRPTRALSSCAYSIVNLTCWAGQIRRSQAVLCDVFHTINSCITTFHILFCRGLAATLRVDYPDHKQARAHNRSLFTYHLLKVFGDRVTFSWYLGSPWKLIKGSCLQSLKKTNFLCRYKCLARSCSCGSGMVLN